MALRMKILESENNILQKKIILLRQEVESLHNLVYEIGRQIPDKLNQTFWSTDSLQSPYLIPQTCCLRNFPIIATTYPTIADSSSTITEFISRLSSILQIPTYSHL